jgi:hypothetical protein
LCRLIRQSKNIVRSVGTKKARLRHYEKPTAKENTALFQQAFIPTMPAVLAGMVRTGLAILTQPLFCVYSNRQNNSGEAARVLT